MTIYYGLYIEYMSFYLDNYVIGVIYRNKNIITEEGKNYQYM